MKIYTDNTSRDGSFSRSNEERSEVKKHLARISLDALRAIFSFQSVLWSENNLRMFKVERETKLSKVTLGRARISIIGLDTLRAIYSFQSVLLSENNLVVLQGFKVERETKRSKATLGRARI